jgi:hypothetical protein
LGRLLVPELKKVVENVQFEHIRDVALSALQALTRALGHADIEAAVASIMREEDEKAEAEQSRLALALKEEKIHERAERRRRRKLGSSKKQWRPRGCLTSLHWKRIRQRNKRKCSKRSSKRKVPSQLPANARDVALRNVRKHACSLVVGEIVW